MKKAGLPKGSIGQDLVNYLRGNNAGNLGIPGMQLREVPLEHLDPFLRMNRGLFDTSSFQYRIITPSDETITGEELLERIGFSKEKYVQLMQLIVGVNKNLIDRASQLSKSEELKYSKFIDSLLSAEKMEEIVIKSSENNISIFQQMLNDCGFLEEGNNIDLNQEIEIINYLIGYVPSVVLELADGAIDDGLSASIGRSDNYKYYSSIILGALLKNIIELKIISPIAIALSKASDYLSPAELDKMVKDVSSEEWEQVRVNVREDIILPKLLAVLINVIRGDQGAVNHSLMETIHSLRENIEGLKAYITTDVEAVFTMAVKFNSSEVIGFILSNCLSIIEKNLVSGEAKTIFYYDMKKYMVILFSALIRGDRDTCLKFLHPTVWKDYTDYEKLEIVKFIILRSGSTTRDILLKEIFTNKDLGLKKFALYIDLLKNVQSDEEYTQLKKAVSLFIAEHIANGWSREPVDTTSEVMQVGSIHTLIELAQEDQEDIILKALHKKKILTFDLYKKVLEQSETRELKEKVKTLFSYYMNFLYLKAHNNEGRNQHLNSEESAKFISAFKTLVSDERIKFIQDISNDIERVINNKKWSNFKKTKALQANRKTLEWITKNELVDSVEKKKVDVIMNSIIQFNIDSLLIDEGKDNLGKPNKKNKGETEERSDQLSSVLDDVKESSPPVALEEDKPDPKRKRKKNKKKPEIEDKSQSKSASTIELSPEEVEDGWQIYSKNSKKDKAEAIIAISSDNPDGPSGGSGAIKSSKEIGKGSPNAKSKPKSKPSPSKSVETKYKNDDKKTELPAESVIVDSNSYKAKLLSAPKSDSKKVEESRTDKSKDNLVVSLDKEEYPELGQSKTPSVVENTLVVEEDSKHQDNEVSSSLVSMDNPQELVANPKAEDGVTSTSDTEVSQNEVASVSVSTSSSEYDASQGVNSAQYRSYQGPHGTHFELVNQQSQFPVVQIRCNRYFIDHYGNRIDFYMDPQGICIDQMGNQFTLEAFHDVSEDYRNLGGNITTGNYGGGHGGGGSGSSGSRTPKKKHGYKGGNKRKAAVEGEDSQGDFKEVDISILSSLSKVKAIYIESEEYQDALQEVQNRLAGDKADIHLDDIHHFNIKSQNVSYVSISQDEDMMPKLPFSESPEMFIGVDKLNIDPIIM